MILNHSKNFHDEKSVTVFLVPQVRTKLLLIYFHSRENVFCLICFIGPFFYAFLLISVCVCSVLFSLYMP